MARDYDAINDEIEDRDHDWTVEDIEEDDYVISDSGPCGSRCSVSIQGGRYLGEYRDEGAALAAIRADMERAQCWPMVWYVNDHGNVFAC